MNNPWRSDRLIYRAPEQPDDEDFFLTIQTDPFAYQNSNSALPFPQGKESAKKYLKHVAENSLICVVICLPAESAGTKPAPIGCMHLDRLSQNNTHHRHADVGIDIVQPYQGKGYGSEAIRWLLKFAFNTAGLHRVGISAFEWNDGAVRLYEKLGFKREGVSRDFIWFDGRWWDGINFSMLEDEWREQQQK